MSELINKLVAKKYNKATPDIEASVVLPILISEAKESARVAKRKEVEQEDIDKAAKSYMKKINSVIEDLKSKGLSVPSNLIDEAGYLEQYLPKQEELLSKEETMSYLVANGLYPIGDRKVGQIMAALPKNISKALVSEIFKK